MPDYPSEQTPSHVMVVYAAPEGSFCQTVPLVGQMTIAQAIEESGVLARIPGIDLSVQRVGIYGKLKDLDTVLRDRDRVEIYRKLVADPMESRRRRAQHRTRIGKS